jgi:hypothetical protein
VAPDVPFHHRNQITERFSSFVQRDSKVAMINGKALMMELT